MKKILKKAELINTVANSVVLVMLVEEGEKIRTFFTETYLFNCQGEELSNSKINYISYRIAAEKYSKLVSELS